MIENKGEILIFAVCTVAFAVICTFLLHFIKRCFEKCKNENIEDGDENVSTSTSNDSIRSRISFSED